MNLPPNSPPPQRGPLPPENPFSTRHVRPGAIEFLFPSGTSLTQLVERLRANDWRGEIVGRHGAGKSTLLRTLEPALAEAGRELIVVSLRDGECRLPAELRQAQAWTAATQIIVDGFEQLSRWNRFRLRWTCRHHGSGLLVTTHQSVGLPLLMAVEPSEATVQQVVAKLLESSPPAVTPPEVAQHWAKHPGDVRETLFALYDLYEQRRAFGK